MGLFDLFADEISPDLAYDAKWNIITSAIEYSITEGISQYATNKGLRDIGLRFDNNRFSDIYKDLSGWRTSFSYQLGIGADTIPKPDLFAQSKYEITADYGYVGQYFTVDQKTGLLKQNTFRYDSDELLTRSDATDALENYFNNKYPKQGEEIVGGIEFIGSIRNIGI